MRRTISLLLALVLVCVPSIARADSPLVPNSPVMLAGPFGVGGTISAIYPSDDQGLTASFEWFADGVRIPDASNSSLMLLSEQVGKVVSARITLRKSGFSDLVVEAPGARVFSELPSGGGMSWGG